MSPIPAPCTSAAAPDLSLALSGASVGSGETLEVAVELEDALIDAGYEIRIDSAVEELTRFIDMVKKVDAGEKVG